MVEPRAERPAMRDYGVNIPDWSPLPWSWATERLDANKNFWVVTVSGEGRPHALPVRGVWDTGESRFAFGCSPSARKARNLAANPRAVVMNDNTVETISIEGEAAPVDAAKRKEWWIERFLPKYRPHYADYSPDFLRQMLMIEFVPERAFAIIEREEEFATRATRWDFDT